MKKGVQSVFIVIILFLILFVGMNFVSAEHNVGNLSHLLTQEYGPGESIRGWVNISFDNEEINSIFDDGDDTSITLEELLEKNTDYEKTCVPKSCLSDYDASAGSSTQTFNCNLSIAFSEAVSGIIFISVFLPLDIFAYSFV